jgi:3-dehydroquinate dehydratase/shikimate dehydrogenase
MDIKTKPEKSSFLQAAEDRGCRLIYGYRIFVEQAIEQFRIWFKNRLDVQASRSILEREACKALQEDDTPGI